MLTQLPPPRCDHSSAHGLGSATVAHDLGHAPNTTPSLSPGACRSSSRTPGASRPGKLEKCSEPAALGDTSGTRGPAPRAIMHVTKNERLVWVGPGPGHQSSECARIPNWARGEGVRSYLKSCSWGGHTRTPPHQPRSTRSEVAPRCPAQCHASSPSRCLASSEPWNVRP